MPAALGAKLLNSSRAKLSFQSSPLFGKRIELPLKVEINKEATKEAREKEPEKRRTILRGYASTPKLDAHKHVIPAGAWKKERALARYSKNPVVLYQHNPEYVVGTADEFEPDKEGLYVELDISGSAKIATGEPLGDLLEDGRLRTLSVGIRILDYEIQEIEGDVFATLTEIELLEISIVSIPANEDATFEVAKEIANYVTKSLGSAGQQDGGIMREMICKSLGLDPEKATDLEIFTAMNKLLGLANAGKTMRKLLGLAEDASEEAVQKALADRDPAKIRDLEEFKRKQTAKDLVAKHAKKVDPALRPWAESYAEKDPEGFETWAKSAPDAVTAGAGTSIVPGAGDGSTNTRPTSTSKTISEEDRLICEKFGAFESAEEMEKLANVAPNEPLSWIFKGKRFGLTTADKDTMRRREERERLVS